MSAFKGTPGPWHAVEHYSDELTVVDGAGFVHVSAKSCAILLDYGSRLGIEHWADDDRACRRMSDEEQAANARLIAQSPALHAIAERIDTYLGMAGEPAEEGSNNPLRDLRFEVQRVLSEIAGSAP